MLRRVSIADAVRAEQAASLMRLTPEERVQLAFALGRRDVELYAAAQSVSHAEARRRLRSLRQLGREPSASARD
jgi:hypothetical protein